MLNDQGGTVPQTQAELKRARATDLGTLPWDLFGTNCGNCSFVRPKGYAGGVLVGDCVHPKVKQLVSVRMCCALWDNPGYLRP